MFTFGNFIKPNEDVINDGNNAEICIPAVEVQLNSSNFSAANTCNFKLNDINIQYLDPSNVLLNLKDIDSTINQAESNHSDLIEGVYEGGLKIWESTYDVANYLYDENRQLCLDKRVLDLGCGSGILGILAYKLGAAEVHYQDYNESVIKHLTIPNNALNSEEMLKKSRFWYGDWKSFSTINNFKYDVILTSETIYNPKNQNKLLMVMKNLLTPNGIIILGAKSYYFGVGGGLKQFLDLIDKDNNLNYDSVWKSEEGYWSLPLTQFYIRLHPAHLRLLNQFEFSKNQQLN